MPAEASSPCAAKEITPEEQVRCSPDRNACHNQRMGNNNSATGTRTRVAWVRAEYPNQLDYSGSRQALEPLHEPFEFRTTAILLPIVQELWRRP